MVDRISPLLNKLGFWHLPAVHTSLLLPPPKDLVDYPLNSTSILTLTVLRSNTPVVPLQYPQESETRAEKYRDYIHWDLWGPASVKSLNGHFYVAAWIDDATWKTKLYFQEKKSKTFNSYKKDEAYIETQTSNCIKTVHSD